MSIDDTTEDARRAQIALLKQLSNTERVAIALRLSSQAIARSRRAIQRQHPEWSEFEVKIHWARLHYGPEVSEMIDRWLAQRRG